MDETCGSANGSITIGAVTGGTAPYSYNFNNLGYPGTTVYTNLSAGCYPLEVKDANGCLFSTAICLTDAPGPTAIATTVTDESCGNVNGCITITGMTGGTAPYTYNFNGSGFMLTTSTADCSRKLSDGCKRCQWLYLYNIGYC